MRIFPGPSLYRFLSIKIHVLLGLTVVMQCSCCVVNETKCGWRLAMRNAVLKVTFIFPMSPSSLPPCLDVPVLPSARSTYTSSTSLIVCNNPMLAKTCTNAALPSTCNHIFIGWSFHFVEYNLLCPYLVRSYGYKLFVLVVLAFPFAVIWLLLAQCPKISWYVSWFTAPDMKRAPFFLAVLLFFGMLLLVDGESDPTLASIILTHLFWLLRISFSWMNIIDT